MKQILNILGIACLGMLFLISLIGCKEDSIDRQPICFAAPSYQTTKWCSTIIEIVHGSGSYDFSVNDQEGIKLSFKKETNQLTVEGLKEGIYEIKLLDKKTKESATTMVKVLPQSLTIFSKRNLKDSLFERQSSLILIADKENRCFMYPIPTGNECSFEGFYKIEENENTPTHIILFDKNKNKIRTYSLNSTSELALDCLYKLWHRQKWEKLPSSFNERVILYSDVYGTISGTVTLESSAIPDIINYEF